EGEKFAAVVLNDVHGVGGNRLTQTLDLDVVLIAPEIWDDDACRCVLAEHRGHGGASLFGDVAPMFHADLMSLRVAPRRDVAERPHVGCAGSAGSVADNAVVDLDAAALAPIGRRTRADAH